MTAPRAFGAAYGVFFTGLLAIVYVPSELVDQFAPACNPGSPGWKERDDKRVALESRLRLEGSAASTFQAGAVILAPLASALVAKLLPTD